MLDDFREWLSDNLRYILLGLGALLIIIIVVFIVRLVGGSGSKTSQSSQTTQTAQTTQSTSGQTAQEDVTEVTEEPAVTAATGTSDLVRDDAAILTLVEQYYTAVVAQDTRTLSTIVSPWDDEVQAQILSSDMIEAYENIRTYSKKGLKDGEYVVFAASEVKITDIDTLVPTLDMLYLVTGSGGSLVIASDMSTDAEISAYVTQVSSDADVQALVKEVNNSYAEALAGDELLSSYMSSSTSAADDDESSGDDASDDTASDTGSSTSSGSSSVSVGSQMTATTTVNIRQTASTSAVIMGVLTEGTAVTVLSDGGDGWVEISYATTSGEIIGYVMSDYLTSAGSAALSDTAEDSSAA